MNFIRSTAEMRNYYEVLPDVVGVLHLQGGNLSGWGGKALRMLDHFQMGPNLVRGFAPAGIGPRDLTPDTTNDALGGTMYWGASVEAQTPLYFLPKEIGIKVAAFADAGSLWNYQRTDLLGRDRRNNCRSPIAMRFARRSAWASSGIPHSGRCVSILPTPVTKESYDRTQIFRFSGGTKF